MIGYPKPGKKAKKHQPGSDPKYKEWLKTQPCSNPKCPGLCGEVTPAHQRILGRGGTSMKPPDKDALPLGYWCHHFEHHGPVSFWGQKTKPKTKIFVQNLCYEHIGRYIMGG